jgi:putative MATE family efflux protein
MSQPRAAIDLARGPIGPALARLVIPMLVGMLMIASVGIVDAYFVGKLGTDALAAFGLCFPFMMLFQSLLFGLAHGITAAMSRLRGERAGQPLGAQERVLIRTAMLCALAVAATLAAIGALVARPVFTAAADEPQLVELALQYYAPYLVSLVVLAVPVSITAALRGLGETRSSATVMTLASFFNAGLDPVFMDGWGPLPAMGIAGVSVATVVANLVGGSYALWLLRKTLRGTGHAALEPAAPAPQPRMALGSIARVALPAMLAQLLGPVAGLVLAMLMARQGTVALAGLSILQRVDMLVMMVPVATGTALLPLVGQSWASGDRQRAALALRLSRRTLVVYGVAMGVLLNAAAGPLVRNFSDEPAVAAVVRLALLVTPIGYIGGGLNISTMSAFNAIGRPLQATKLAAVFAVLLLPALAALFGELYGVLGIFGGAVSASALSAILGTYWMRLEGLAPNAE